MGLPTEENLDFIRYSLFEELTGSVAAMRAHRAGKITQRRHRVEPRALPEVKPKMIKKDAPASTGVRAS